MRVCDLYPGALLQFISTAGPIPVDDTCPELQTALHFNWTWKAGHVPRHMIYVGAQRKDGKLIYEILWNDSMRTISGYCFKHLERVTGSEDIRGDDRASSPQLS